MKYLKCHIISLLLDSATNCSILKSCTYVDVIQDAHIHSYRFKIYRKTEPKQSEIQRKSVIQHCNVIYRLCVRDKKFQFYKWKNSLYLIVVKMNIQKINFIKISNDPVQIAPRLQSSMSLMGLLFDLLSARNMCCATCFDPMKLSEL